VFTVSELVALNLCISMWEISCSNQASVRDQKASFLLSAWVEFALKLRSKRSAELTKPNELELEYEPGCL
jgi:hypothetical protein